jgi:hypothetical protein
VGGDGVGKPISLFSGYSQRENRTTNYCLLVLKLLYEENPRFLAEAFGALLGEDIADLVGVTFRQQEKKTRSVPDGLIVQKPITIYIETKNFDWFYNEQLENHLTGLEQDSAGLKVLIALGPFEGNNNSRFTRIQALCKDKYRGEILFAALTFEDFIMALQLPHLPKSLADTVSELRAYFDEEGLLPSWSNWLDVVNCAGIPEDILETNAYMCPATGGAYSHSRCAFFGMYRNKCVERIADILAVVDVESAVSAAIKWKNSPDDDSTLKKKAIEIVLQRRPDDLPTRIFLLGELFETEFIKDSPGGMMGSKQYFNVGRLGAKTAQEVACALRGKVWSDVQSSDS